MKSMDFQGYIQFFVLSTEFKILSNIYLHIYLQELTKIQNIYMVFIIFLCEKLKYCSEM